MGCTSSTQAKRPQNSVIKPHDDQNHVQTNQSIKSSNQTLATSKKTDSKSIDRNTSPATAKLTKDQKASSSSEILQNSSNESGHKESSNVKNGLQNTKSHATEKTLSESNVKDTSSAILHQEFKSAEPIISNISKTQSNKSLNPSADRKIESTDPAQTLNHTESLITANAVNNNLYLGDNSDKQMPVKKASKNLDDTNDGKNENKSAQTLQDSPPMSMPILMTSQKSEKSEKSRKSRKSQKSLKSHKSEKEKLEKTKISEKKDKIKFPGETEILKKAEKSEIDNANFLSKEYNSREGLDITLNEKLSIEDEVSSDFGNAVNKNPESSGFEQQPKVRDRGYFEDIGIDENYLIHTEELQKETHVHQPSHTKDVLDIITDKVVCQNSSVTLEADKENVAPVTSPLENVDDDSISSNIINLSFSHNDLPPEILHLDYDKPFDIETTEKLLARISAALLELDFSQDALKGRKFEIPENATRLELYDGAVYTGETQNFKPEGIGKTCYESGNFHIGEYKNGKPNGYGIYESDRFVYKGLFSNGKAHGFAVYTFDDGTKYCGYYKSDKREGYGHETQLDGLEYIGTFMNGKKHGVGILRAPNKEMYEGNFREGKIEGVGKYTWQDGRVYIGMWKSNMQHGYAEFRWPNNQKYCGFYAGGKMEGYGVLELPNGCKYDGLWRKGLQHGKGKYWGSSRWYREVEFDNGKFVQWTSDPISATT